MRTLILNSAHGKLPVGSEGWIQATLRAVREQASRNTTFLCSTEPVPWDLTAYLAGETGANIELIVKAPGDERGGREYARLLDDFGFSGERVRPGGISASIVES